MMFRARCAYVACLLIALPAAVASQRPAEAVRQERAQAAREAPLLAETLALKPGMSVADIGAGGGAMSRRIRDRKSRLEFLPIAAVMAFPPRSS